jgi:ribosomal protein L9
MEEMGGGGHLNSAATQIYDVSMSQVKNQLIDLLKRDFEIGDEVMKVILLEDVKGRGAKNQIIEVAVGYGNYLISNKKGILATDANLAKLKEDLHQAQVEAENQKKLMQKIKEEIEEKCVNIYIKIGADGKLFGHVTTKQICDEFEAQTGIRLDKRKVSLKNEINALGVYTANVDLHKDIQANLEINVLEK